jgi:hypothetical protein
MHGDDPRAFSHAETRRDTRDVPLEGHGQSSQTSARKLPGGPAVHTDKDRHPVFSNNELTADAHRTSDRLRSRTQRVGLPADAHDLSIASERHGYTD